MRIDHYRAKNRSACQREAGVSLLEVIVFMLVISIALGALLRVYQQSLTRSVEPIVRVRMLELAQSRLDAILTYPYDDSTPPGGIPACDAVPPSGMSPVACTGGGVSRFDGTSDEPHAGYSRQVSVEDDMGDQVGLQPDAAKRISVTVTSPEGESLTLSAYRTNF